MEKSKTIYVDPRRGLVEKVDGLIRWSYFWIPLHGVDNPNDPYISDDPRQYFFTNPKNEAI